MELREYWGIAARRWPFIAAVTLLTLVASTLMIAFGPTMYKSEMRLTISTRPEPRQGDYYMYDRYYTWLTAEYLVDDFGEVIKSDAFAQDVAARLGQTFDKDAIQRELTTKKTHRILTITVTTLSAQQSYDIATAVKAVLEETAPTYFVQLDSNDAMLRVIDDPQAQPEMGLVRRVAEIALRTLVGFIAAVALAFLIHYLDPTLRTPREAEQILGMPILGEIPRVRGRDPSA